MKIVGSFPILEAQNSIRNMRKDGISSNKPFTCNGNLTRLLQGINSVNISNQKNITQLFSFSVISSFVIKTTVEAFGGGNLLVRRHLDSL